MTNQVRAVLRNAHGEHLRTLTPDEVEFYSRRAEAGELIKSRTTRKGRVYLVFRLKPACPPAPEPSKSPESSASLTRSDMAGLAGELGPVSRRMIERWIGFGLLPVTA